MYQKNTANESILRSIKKMQPEEGEVVGIFLGETQLATDIPKLIDQLKAAHCVFFGGLFPGLIHGTRSNKQGVLLQKFKAAVAPVVIREISGGRNFKFRKLKLPDDDAPLLTLTLVDGLASDITNFLEQLNNRIGGRTHFLGGGAGSLSLKQQPCIFSNEGFFQDAALVCPLAYPGRLGVRHGWQQLVGPVVATKTTGNIIHELNWEKAFDVYRQAVESDAQQRLLADNFFGIAKSYPFGLFRENQEKIVRDPIAVGENGALVCVGEVPPNSVLHILKGEKKNLIQAAEQATQDSLDVDGPDPEHIFIVDCISRSLFLESSFTEELEAIKQRLDVAGARATPHGVLSLGEISSYGSGMLEFFNKTIVVGLMG